MASRKTEGIALTTGAASGIGKDSAFSFADSGALRVIFADRNEAGAREAAEASKEFATNPNYSAVAVYVEITDVESVQKMVDMTLQENRRIDYYVHSAGIGSDTFSLVSDASLEEFDKILDVNLRGTLICNRAVLKAMGTQEQRTFTGRNGSRDIERGSIVNVGSMNSLGPLPGRIPYTASKHGVTAVTKTAELETARLEIRVNMVCPTWVVSSMTEAELARNPKLDSLIKTAVPASRMAAPNEVADTIVFLSSAAASYITGQAIIIDNGLALTVRLWQVEERQL